MSSRDRVLLAVLKKSFGGKSFTYEDVGGWNTPSARRMRKLAKLGYLEKTSAKTRHYHKGQFYTQFSVPRKPLLERIFSFFLN